MLAAIDSYRDHNPRYQDVWSWDVIVYADRSIRVLCWTSGCLYDYGHMGRDCDCAEKSRMSSPVVDKYGRPLQEGYPWEGVARHLLSVTDGSSVPVMSGKAYRVTGPRVAHEGFREASIWEIYKDPEEPEPEPPGFFYRAWEWLNE